MTQSLQTSASRRVKIAPPRLDKGVYLETALIAARKTLSRLGAMGLATKSSIPHFAPDDDDWVRSTPQFAILNAVAEAAYSYMYARQVLHSHAAWISMIDVDLARSRVWQAIDILFARLFNHTPITAVPVPTQVSYLNAMMGIIISQAYVGTYSTDDVLSVNEACDRMKCDQTYLEHFEQLGKIHAWYPNGGDARVFIRPEVDQARAGWPKRYTKPKVPLVAEA